MPEQVVDLRQVGHMWQVTLNGETLACSMDRAGAICATAGLLRRQLTDAEFATQLRLSGLELHELMPAKPVEGRSEPPTPTIDFATAKRLITEKWLPVAEKRVGT